VRGRAIDVVVHENLVQTVPGRTTLCASVAWSPAARPPNPIRRLVPGIGPMTPDTADLDRAPGTTGNT